MLSISEKIYDHLGSFSFKKLSNKIVNNITFLVLIPTIFGGLFQIIELVKIDPSLIKFFSITQLIPDGLMILFAILVFIASIIIYYIIYPIWEGVLKIKIKMNLTLVVLTTIFSLLIFVRINFYECLQCFGLPFSKLTLFSKYLLLYSLISIFSINNISFIIENFINEKKTGKDVIVTKFFIFSFINTLLLIFSIFLMFYSSYNLLNKPNKLINYTNVIAEIRETHKNYDVNLNYFNDKYFFFTLIDKNLKSEGVNKLENEKYLVVPFEKINSDK